MGTIDGDILINSNENLTKIDNFPKLTKFNGNIFIGNNNNLVTFPRFENLLEIEVGLGIGGNGITILDNFPNLASVGEGVFAGGLSIGNDTELEIVSFPKLIFLNSLNISNNESLKELNFRFSD